VEDMAQSILLKIRNQVSGFWGSICCI